MNRGRPKGPKKIRVSAQLWLTKEEHAKVKRVASKESSAIATMIKRVVMAYVNTIDTVNGYDKKELT